VKVVVLTVGVACSVLELDNEFFMYLKSWFGAFAADLVMFASSAAVAAGQPTGRCLHSY
jgi:hypothetical protein